MSRALLVIDVRNEYFTGAFPITHPAGHHDQILRVMAAAEGRVPTVVVQHHFLDKPFFRLCAQQMLLSEVLPSSAWIDRLQ
jgi:nicotinamidase-related amidase